MFDHHPTKKEFGAAAGKSYYWARRLVGAGIVRTVEFTDQQRPHRDDCNRVLDEGLTAAERKSYQDYLRAEAKPKKAANQ